MSIDILVSECNHIVVYKMGKHKIVEIYLICSFNFLLKKITQNNDNQYTYV